MYKKINTAVAVLFVACIAALCFTFYSLNQANGRLSDTTTRLDATTDSLATTRQLNDSLAADANHLRMQVAEADSARENAENGLAKLKSSGKGFRLIAINPTVKKENTISQGKVTVNKVTIDPEGTSVKLSFNNPKTKRGSYMWTWAQIKKETYIVAQGKKYKMTRAEGIEVSPATTDMEARGSLTFTLHFPVIPSSTTKIDLVEPGTDWQFYGISLR